MVRKVFAVIDISSFEKALQQLGQNAPRVMEELVLEAAQAGANKMKELVETRGTEEQWTKSLRAKEDPPRGSHKDYSYPGRVNTGNMRDLIRARVQRGPKQVQAAFGWLDPFSPEDRYIEAQENGFTKGGFRPDKTVKGMFARRDARLYVQQTVIPRLVRKYVKRFLKGA
tara:strand:+ start:2053 stop:2562 length:510 start_codon:yes stop_codon:yes gene_type:complete